MPNLFLTNECDRGCVFCFAKEGPWSEKYPPRPLTMEEVVEFVAMPPMNERPERGIVGGEPLQYPQLVEVIRLMWQKKLTPKIFTSGSCQMPEGLHSLDITGRIHFLVNISSWDSYPPERQNNLDQFLTTFGKHVSLAYTILDPDIDPAFLLDYTAHYHLYPFIRVGVAVPTGGGTNQYVVPDRYREVGLRLLDLAKKAAKQYVRMGTDCGFVACMFTPEELGTLYRLGMDITFQCQPVVDVGPELDAWHCLPLAKLGRFSLRDCGSMTQINKEFQTMGKKLRERFGPGIYAKCAGCKYLARGQCAGGCLGHIVPEEECRSEAFAIQNNVLA
jgi:hypothetical protein